MPAATPTYLTTGEVAGQLRLSVERVYDLVRDGVLPARRLTPRGRLLIHPDDVERALQPAGRSVESGAAQPSPAVA
jgi:excisionase family DNA binding protein